MNTSSDIFEKLAEKKKEWYDKKKEMEEYCLNYQPSGRKEDFTDFQNKLNSIQDEVRAIGKSYRELINQATDEITKDIHNEVVDKMVQDIKSEIDYEWDIFHGNREKKLEFLYEFIAYYGKFL